MVWRWRDGASRTDVVSWNIEPVIRLQPAFARLSLQEVDKSAKVIITSSDRPFKLIDFEGPPYLDKPTTPTEELKSHALELRINGNIDRNPEDLHYVEITTNHPMQAALRLPVLIGR